MINSADNFEKELSFAKSLLDETRAIANHYFRKSFSQEVKGDNTPVTIADKDIERSIRQAIQRQFPDHGIIGEEYNDYNEESPYQWVIDPIDGTKAFITGIPVFCTLIALCFEGRPVLGLIHQPISDELWYGLTGKGAYFCLASSNDKATKLLLPKHNKPLSSVIICTSAPSHMEKAGKTENFRNLQSQSYFTRYGADSYAAGQLASGHVDVMIETGLKLYDYAALIPIINGAGGIVSDWQGNELTLASRFENPNGSFLASNSELLHKTIINIMK